MELREIDSGDQSAVIGYQGQLLSGEPGHQPTKTGLGQGDRLCLGAWAYRDQKKDGSCMENLYLDICITFQSLTLAISASVCSGSGASARSAQSKSA